MQSKKTSKDRELKIWLQFVFISFSYTSKSRIFSFTFLKNDKWSFAHDIMKCLYFGTVIIRNLLNR